MQEQNFEKQVREKMEELSLTPSEPVWEKVEEQIQKKRDRKRFFFWLPLTVLLIGGGVWFLSGVRDNNNSIAINKEQNNNTTNTTSRLEKTSTINQNQKTKTSLIKDDEQTPITSKNFEKQNENIFESKTGKEFLPTVKKNKKESKISRTQQNQTVNTGNVPSKKQAFTKEPKDPGRTTNSGIPDVNEKSGIEEVNEEPGNKIIEKSSPYDTLADSQLKQNELKNEDTINTAPGVKANEKDSLSVQKDIATNKKNFSSKWRFAIAAGIGRSGVNNGVGLFNGGAKSLETTNAFAADRSSNFSQAPSNAGGAVYRPPSSQEKSSSFLLGVLVKKQVGKRSSLSTGLQYNFYSTQMEVGENIVSDTVVDQNKSVSSFYSNSGSNFSTYRNKFHFISLPMSFDFQLLKKIPLDLHFGLSLQQMVETNALLYSSGSQVYYNDESAFNKTQLFSELGLEYSFPLSRKLLFRVGPRFSYSHSRVIKESSDRHLFSYGLATQFVFAGK